jgi:hypothetical protein
LEDGHFKISPAPARQMVEILQSEKKKYVSKDIFTDTIDKKNVSEVDLATSRSNVNYDLVTYMPVGNTMEVSTNRPVRYCALT